MRGPTPGDRVQFAVRSGPPSNARRRGTRLVAVFVSILLIAACSGQDSIPGTIAPSVTPSVTDTGGSGPTPVANPATTAPAESIGPTNLPTPPTAAPTGTRVAPTTTPVATHTPGPTVRPTPEAATLADLVGQKLIIRMDGTTPSPDLLERIRRGEIGGVILFGANVTTAAAVRQLTSELQAAAAGGGRPPLLIATDQEGGAINRIPWAPPTLSAPQMGSDGSAPEARTQGVDTGAALLALGINVDLAPVADVPGSVESFMYLQHRTWSFSAATTSTLANAFAGGLESSGVLPAMKHFPGIGFAIENTDAHVVTLAESVSALAPGISPYRVAIEQHIPMVMLSNAIYSAYDPTDGAGWSAAIAGQLLRHDLGFAGVTITDSLTGAAVARGVAQDLLALQAAQAGTDMILVTGDEASTRTVYATLLAAAADGSLPRSTLEAPYGRILALKAGLDGPTIHT